MSMYKKYFYDKETKDAVVKVRYKGKESTGRAKVHPDDMEFENEYAGYAIAEFRAKQKAHHKVCVDLNDRMRVAKAELAELERQLTLHKDAAKSLELAEIEFLECKERFYQSVRELRDPKKQAVREQRMQALKGMLGAKKAEIEAE